ncbi:alpha/beta hydrolase [Aspergillus lucknowensis]|uniref:Alpha/Beta hydrolase protein n=1 Tax=Aspergillus lucknowensis TaxID=176173 RepID=A0ABR4M229_9EURO
MPEALSTDNHDLEAPPRLSTWDICWTLITLLLYAPLTVLASLYRKGALSEWNDTKEQISHDLVLCFGLRLPVSVIQRAGAKTGSILQQSPRYAHAPFKVAEKVQKPDFTGYWVYRDMSAGSCLQDTDLVIFHLHGGGYVMGHPLDNAPELLLIADSLSRRSHTIAVFSLEYTLVPRAPLPTQLVQAAAAYTWLINEQNIIPSKIYLVGESAGGHLILSLLTLLYQRHLRGQSPDLPKPAAAFLISPWVNLDPTGPDARAEHRTLDSRSASFKHVLERFSVLVRRNVTAQYSELYGNFARSASGRESWKDILPAKTWVSAGTAEPLFRFDIEEFVEAARRDGAEVRFELAEGKEHVWQSVEARGQEKKYLALALGEDDPELMPGYRHIAELICSALEGGS